MNQCGYQQKNAFGSCEEMRMESVVCPKPRRLAFLNHSSIDNHIRPLRSQFINYQSEIEDSGAGAELLDIIFPKGSCYPEGSGVQVASPPPFFCGSPPSRASNPVIQDEQFGNSNSNGNFSPFSLAPPSPSSSARGCDRFPLSFPETSASSLSLMAVRTTALRFPIDTDAREGSGLLWGVTMIPFAVADENGQAPVYGSGVDLLLRCENCWAYFNTYRELEQWSWPCFLCGTFNGLSSSAVEHYS